MAPATATQDEDLLIISEDTTENTNDIDFSFSFGEEASSATTPVLDTVQSTSLEEPVIATTEVPAETSASLGDFSFDIFSQTSPAPTSEVHSELTLGEREAPTLAVVETLVDTSSQINVGDISLPDASSNPLSLEAQAEEISVISPVVQEEMIAPSAAIISELPQAQAQEVSGAESLNDILTATIAKLTLRAEIISTDSSGKSTQIASIQAQIKALEEQVSALEGEISLLSTESEKISKNIEALEEMKLDPVKEHNARRAVKK